jgi:hypothetical protein
VLRPEVPSTAQVRIPRRIGADGRTFVVNIRNEIGRIILKAPLVVGTEWIEAPCGD